MDMQSLHERVMAEQGRGSGTAADVGPTTTTPDANSSPPITSPTATTPAEQEDATSIVLSGGLTPIKGAWSGTAEQLASFLLNASPSPRFTVSTAVLAEYYMHYCAEAGLRADLLWAQMIHETGYGMYGGAAVPEQNNYAGIGTTGGGEPGLSFPTADAGVMAHVAHMVAYVYTSSPVPWANASTDPRFDLVSPRGAAAVLTDLNGRWAVPGTTYGEAIEAIARAINAVGQ
ncbi:MAG TPA: glucosaminidase domain-containing protein [Thermoleophilia bacterium]|nr:glucosaminidase domain-containing protein [Thermoleophilia bacterium]